MADSDKKTQESPTAVLRSLGINLNPEAKQEDTSSLKAALQPEVENLADTEKGETKITDFEGRFGFLVEKGKYEIKVGKSGYKFPSKVLKGKTEDLDRKNLYFGGDFVVDNPELVNVSIPMDSASFNWNQASKPKQYHPPIIPWQNLSFILTMFGLGLSILAYIISPTKFNFFLVLVYLAVIGVTRILFKPRKWGVVYKAFTGEVVPLATVKALRAGAVVSTAITDHLGRYYMLLSEGDHTLQVEKQNTDGTSNVLGKIGPISVHKADTIVAPNITI